MLKQFVTAICNAFERDPAREKWPERPRTTHLVMTQAFGMTLIGGVYVAEPDEKNQNN
jgi:hypothetical protein